MSIAGDVEVTLLAGVWSAIGVGVDDDDGDDAGGSGGELHHQLQTSPNGTF